MLSNQDYYTKKALQYNANIGGTLMKEYCLQMVEVETSEPFIGSGEQSTQRMQVRTTMQQKAKELAVRVAIVEVAANFKATCFIFEDGSGIRTDSFA